MIYGQRVTNPNDVSSATESIYTWFQSIRQGFVYDEFGIQTEFQAKVLSRPVFVSGREAGAQPHTKFMYKARILGNPSPHDYIPDPCDANLASDSDEALKIINLHTTFITSEDFGSGYQAPPKIGDIVNVELTPGKFSYDLQVGTHIAVKNLNTVVIRDPTQGQVVVNNCESLIELFDKAFFPKTLKMAAKELLIIRASVYVLNLV